MDRRHFIKGFLGSAAVLGAGLPIRRARAAVSGSDLKFIFVFNQGGWDPTRVFATEFSNGNVDMEPGAAQASRGGMSWVSHPDRPSVDSYFQINADRMLVTNGMLVRSISHDICTMLALTGSTSGFAPDWPAIIAADAAERYTLPHLVLGGPSFPGELGVAVARSGSNGQLEGLLSGNILDLSDTPVDGLSQPAQGTIDRYLLRRAAARATGGRSEVDDTLSAAFSDAMRKAVDLKDYRYVMDFTGGADLSSQAQVAVDALQVGLSRCVTLGYPGASVGLGWDSHADNDATQSQLFEGLFLGLGQLMSLLQSTPGSQGGALADETVVVVLSEMGRTAQLNATSGKDHWPYTSAMLLGPNLTTGRVVGGSDEGYYGLNIDLGTGEVDDNGRILSAEALGATLLAAADIDPGEHIMDADPITGLLA
ncbi:MAG: hypothetical protein ACI8S6_002870 [Myxococcota bacterium]|jgi:hypothetical protein